MSIPKEVVEALEEMAQRPEKEFPPSWQWDEEGKVFVGQVIEVREIEREVEGEVREARLAECVDVEGQRWTVWLNLVVLQRLWDEKNVGVGNYVRAEFTGKKGRTKLFKLHVLPSNVSLDFLEIV